MIVFLRSAQINEIDPMCCLGLTPRRLLKNSDADYDVLR